MKICAIICEYNPFHNGHLYQLKKAKELTNADAVLCIMSGNFVQRGEAAIADKYTRAKHAILGGADVVIELPTPFATANAELFAKGAIAILSKIPCVSYLCFGAETANAKAFMQAAQILNDEPKDVSCAIKQLLNDGLSYAKARAQAFSKYIPNELLSSSNNILGLEYTKAILAAHSSIEIVPIARQGATYHDASLKETYASATAIRLALLNGENVSTHVPLFVANKITARNQAGLELLEKYALLTHSTQEIAAVCDCKEGLENALKAAANENVSLVENVTSARYTSSRIRRIALQNLLKIPETLIRNALQTNLYLNVLAVKKERKDVLSALSESNLPILARPRDEALLFDVAKRCYETDLFGEKVHALLYGNPGKINVFID
jgi:predicted nucleotidyltransferase